MTTPFTRPYNDLVFALAQPYAPGAGVLHLASLAGVPDGRPDAGHPIRLSLTRKRDGAKSIVVASGRTGTTLTSVAVAEGKVDLPFDAGDLAFMRMTAGYLADLQDAHQALEVTVAAIGVGSQGPQGPAGPKGDTGAAGAASTVAGPKGDKGDKGDTGAAGAASTVAGPTGAAGATGATGAPGATGATGGPGVVAATAPLTYDSGTQTVAITLPITEAQVANLTADLAARATVASPTFTGTATIPAASIAVHYGAWTAATDAGTVTLNLAATDKYTLLATSGVGAGRTIAFSNFTVGQVLLVEFVQAASGGPYTLTWPTIRWAGGVAPTPATAASKADLFTIVKRSDGTYAGALSIPNY